MEAMAARRGNAQRKKGACSPSGADQSVGERYLAAAIGANASRQQVAALGAALWRLEACQGSGDEEVETRLTHLRAGLELHKGLESVVGHRHSLGGAVLAARPWLSGTERVEARRVQRAANCARHAPFEDPGRAEGHAESPEEMPHSEPEEKQRGGSSPQIFSLWDD